MVHLLDSGVAVVTKARYHPPIIDHQNHPSIYPFRALVCMERHLVLLVYGYRRLVMAYGTIPYVLAHCSYRNMGCK